MEEINLLTEKVIGCAIEVHRGLGPGLLESAYERCLSYELTAAGISHDVQRELPIVYKGVRLECGYRADVVVEDRLLLELKASEGFLPIHEAQILTHMKLSGVKVGLLMNFNVRFLKDGIRRFIL